VIFNPVYEAAPHTTKKKRETLKEGESTKMLKGASAELKSNLNVASAQGPKRDHLEESWAKMET